MRSTLILSLIFFSFLNCKSQNQKKITENLIENNKTLLDSIEHFSMLPIQFNEQYRGSKVAVKNKDYMERCLDFVTLKHIPDLVEMLKDTTTTSITYAGEVPLRKGDIALNILQVVDNTLPIQQMMYTTFRTSEKVSFQEFKRKNIHGVDNVFISMLFNKSNHAHVNYPNRVRLYNAIKKQYKISEK
ncbi:hypothetical protein [Aquimarina longa]|uniref:hypothetical protein n=1 Tax=Aquimarina longa TaxID=1080221 RepID=UPI0007816B3B|nr:hypothetical protein [Aquimarina longa]